MHHESVVSAASSAAVDNCVRLVLWPGSFFLMRHNILTIYNSLHATYKCHAALVAVPSEVKTRVGELLTPFGIADASLLGLLVIMNHIIHLIERACHHSWSRQLTKQLQICP